MRVVCNVFLKDISNFFKNLHIPLIFSEFNLTLKLVDQIYSRVAYIYVRSRAKYLKFRTTTSKIIILGKPLMQQKSYFIHEM